MEQGPDFWCWFDTTQFSYHCVHPIHAKMFSIQMLLHFSQIVQRVCTLVLFIFTVFFLSRVCCNTWHYKTFLNINLNYTLFFFLIHLYRTCVSYCFFQCFLDLAGMIPKPQEYLLIWLASSLSMYVCTYKCIKNSIVV